MRHLLATSSLRILERFARANALLAFDYDGTLAPIVPDPASAFMRQDTRWLLEDLADIRPCVVISSRTPSDVSKRLRGVGVREIVGSYGIGDAVDAQRFAEEVASWGPVLEANLSGRPGVVVENKIFAVAVHYRRARDKRRALDGIHEAARGLRARVIGGKDVVNLFPYGAPHKGMALETSIRRLGSGSAIYVGDDESDEDAFRMAGGTRLLTIRVGEHYASRAAFYLRDQAELDELLRHLIEIAADRPKDPEDSTR